MALQQDDVRSWSPGAPSEPSEAAAMLTDLSAHRPARRPSNDDAAAVGHGTPPSGSDTPTTPGLAALGLENPTSPGFSPDGQFWWDGRRWTPTGSLERPGADTDTDAGPWNRRRPPALIAAGVVAAVLAVLGLAALPVLWNMRGGSDEVLQTALLEVAEAQQRHLVDHGHFAPEAGDLEIYLLRLGGLPAGVTLEIHASDEMTFCAAASVADGGRLWVTESGTVTSTSCA